MEKIHLKVRVNVLKSLSYQKGLSAFLGHPRIPMENNAFERTLRAPVISSCLSFGSSGPLGAETAGRLFSVLQTVTMNGLNPYM
ncbi:MAG: hypothetical protein OXN89_00870 [Bryobacterales bacterium]|nr:hypothetical protein [Bryobacterales bacterium]